MQKMERINRSLILRVQELEGLINQQGLDMPPMDDKDEIIGYLGGNPGKGKNSFKYGRVSINSGPYKPGPLCFVTFGAATDNATESKKNS